MLKPYTELQKTRIVNNIVKACENPSLLNEQGYKYLYLCYGFIAHYNRFGFISYYETHSLKEDIYSNIRNNQWNNFHPSDENYDYYMSKKDIYNRIIDKIK